jgi:hypothetical protein
MTPDLGTEGFFELVAVPVVEAVGEKNVRRFGMIFKPLESFLRHPRIDQHRRIGAGEETGVNSLADPFVEGGPVKNARKNLFHWRLLASSILGAIPAGKIGTALRAAKIVPDRKA